MSSAINIAIDGPSGVGKSTIADRVAESLHMVHLDTGAMYRCVAYYLVSHQIDLSDSQALDQALDSIHISFQGKQVFLNDVDVSKEIRTNEISMFSSKVATNPSVRKDRKSVV